MDTLTVGNPSSKKSVNLAINNELLQQAKALNINLSQTLERHLGEVVQQIKREQWLAENQAALDEYNRRVETSGVFSDGLRRF
ncbi:MAG: type II toxin-antitoxin system CcdA family antitoxin [Nitrosomonadales bacterium]|nr:type II toxin-antitoxin system CcdA family antitoxin [Nitrosomonadales bacterium]